MIGQKITAIFSIFRTEVDSKTGVTEDSHQGKTSAAITRGTTTDHTTRATTDQVPISDSKDLKISGRCNPAITGRCNPATSGKGLPSATNGDHPTEKDGQTTCARGQETSINETTPHRGHQLTGQKLFAIGATKEVILLDSVKQMISIMRGTIVMGKEEIID